MPYSSTMIANNILSRAFAEDIAITPMKLQKILYFAASEYRKRSGKRLLAEPFQTWAFGPVLYSVYDEFRPFSKTRINRYAKDARNEAFVIDEQADDVLRHTLEQVWAATKYKNAVQLSELTHVEGSAWDRAFQENEPVLDDDDVAADQTYREQLRLAGQ